jgi:predicted GH43/DUF377 family glycosyl hydrolase
MKKSRKQQSSKSRRDANFSKKIQKLKETKSAKKARIKKGSKLLQPQQPQLLSSLHLTKAEENPIIIPRREHPWESWQTFNPGVILLENKIHFLYRAIGEDGISRFGYAASNDGFEIDERLPHPIYEHRNVNSAANSPAASNCYPAFNYYSFASGGSFGGAEDPRPVRVNKEDELYITYTACDQGLRVALTSIKVNDFLRKKWDWNPPVLISPPGETHKNWVIFPEKIRGKYAVLHSISPEISIAYRDSLMFQRGEYIHSYYDGKNKDQNSWDKWIRGAGAPPLKTNRGWLIFYHAMDNDWSKYKVGAMLLDLNDPTKILHRSPEPILTPEKDYENNGSKPGVVYVSGAVVKNGELLVYYGASDSYISVAHANLEEFLSALVRKTKPQLKPAKLKKK